MLQYYGFYEPDGYFHYSMIRAAVNNNFILPPYLGISGWPPSCNNYNCGSITQPHHEPYGLYWVTLIPYFFLRFLGISYYTVQRLVPVAFGILDVIAAYFLARYWSKDKLFLVLVMLFIGLNMGNAARTSALIYRGDSFVTFFFLLALVFTVEIFKNENRRMKLAFTLLAAITLALCNLVWNGAAFATAIYIFALLLMLVFGFTSENKKMIDNCGYMLGVLLVWYWIVAIFKWLSWIASIETFTGTNFFLLFVPIAIGWYVIDHVLKHPDKIQYVNTPMKRAIVALAAIAIGFLAIYLIIPSFVSDIFTTSGFLITNAFSSTIQELQVPTYSFLFASFGFQNFTNPMSIILVLSTYFPNLVLLFWFVLLACFIPYLFMHVEHTEEGMMSGHAKIKFAFSETTLILISYFALTAYLQMSAIRFNSLLSIPISIFSAYTIYWLMLFVKRYKLAYYASFILLFVLIVYILQSDANYIIGLAPADQINPQFISAMAWLRNNSAPNSVVLALWPDGSVVEGVGNRTAVTDSVQSQYAYKADPFAAWLYNSTPDPQFLLANISGEPDYLVVRNAWMVETGGIFTEAGINGTNGSYGFIQFQSLNEKVNQTTQTFQFYSSSGLEAQTVIKRGNATNASSITSYLVLQHGIQPFGYIEFYNELGGNFSIIKQTSFNVTNNQTLQIVYSPIPANNLYVNITGAYMFGTALERSNMIKFLYQCNPNVCTWNNNIASLHEVFGNTDTKIYQILYNQSNPAVKAVSYPRRTS